MYDQLWTHEQAGTVHSTSIHITHLLYAHGKGHEVIIGTRTEDKQKMFGMVCESLQDEA